MKIQQLWYNLMAVKIYIIPCQNFFNLWIKNFKQKNKNNYNFVKKYFLKKVNNFFDKIGGDIEYKHYPKTSSYVYQYHLYPYN